jgi:hypothetical protein
VRRGFPAVVLGSRQRAHTQDNLAVVGGAVRMERAPDRADASCERVPSTAMGAHWARARARSCIAARCRRVARLVARGQERPLSMHVGKPPRMHPSNPSTRRDPSPCLSRPVPGLASSARRKLAHRPRAWATQARAPTARTAPTNFNAATLKRITVMKLSLPSHMVLNTTSPS